VVRNLVVSILLRVVAREEAADASTRPASPPYLPPRNDIPDQQLAVGRGA
jgi:hypothetical protein